MPHGSVLRIEPVKASRDDATISCVAQNSIGEPARASASLQVYPQDQGKPFAFFSPFRCHSLEPYHVIISHARKCLEICRILI
jgi:hypothetical protein